MRIPGRTTLTTTSLRTTRRFVLPTLLLLGSPFLTRAPPILRHPLRLHLRSQHLFPNGNRM